MAHSRAATCALVPPRAARGAGRGSGSAVRDAGRYRKGRSVLITAESRERFDVTPKALWPFIADTERLNRALGLLPVRYESTTLGGKPTLLGEYRAAGRTLGPGVENPPP